jgi:hypothetical protein
MVRVRVPVFLALLALAAAAPVLPGAAPPGPPATVRLRILRSDREAADAEGQARRVEAGLPVAANEDERLALREQALEARGKLQTARAQRAFLVTLGAAGITPQAERELELRRLASDLDTAQERARLFAAPGLRPSLALRGARARLEARRAQEELDLLRRDAAPLSDKGLQVRRWEAQVRFLRAYEGAVRKARDVAVDRKERVWLELELVKTEAKALEAQANLKSMRKGAKRP